MKEENSEITYEHPFISVEEFKELIVDISSYDEELYRQWIYDYGYRPRKDIDLSSYLFSIYNDTSSKKCDNANLCLAYITFESTCSLTKSLPFIKAVSKERQDKVYYFYGYAYKCAKKYEESIKYFKKAIKYNDIDSQRELAHNYYLLNNFREAADCYLDYGKHEERESFKREALSNAATLYQKVGLFEKALKVYNLMPDEFGNEIGDLYFNGLGVEKDYQKAVINYAKGICPTYDLLNRDGNSPIKLFLDSPQFKLAKALYYGLGVKKNVKKAIFYIYLAIQYVDVDYLDYDNIDDYFFKTIKPKLSLFSKRSSAKNVKDTFWCPAVFKLYNVVRFNRDYRFMDYYSRLLYEETQAGDDARFAWSVAHLRRNNNSRPSETARDYLEKLKSKGYHALRNADFDNPDIPDVFEENTIRFYPFECLAEAYADQYENIARIIVDYPIDYLRCERHYRSLQPFEYCLKVSDEIDKKLYSILLLVDFHNHHDKKFDKKYEIDVDELLLADLNSPLQIQI